LPHFAFIRTRFWIAGNTQSNNLKTKKNSEKKKRIAYWIVTIEKGRQTQKEDHIQKEKQLELTIFPAVAGLF